MQGPDQQAYAVHFDRSRETGKSNLHPAESPEILKKRVAITYD
jgi:hypothetical protein